MTSPVMEFNLWYGMPSLLILLVVILYTSRKRFNRKSYSGTEKFALLNIATLGPFVLMIMFGILSAIIRIFLTNPFWFPWEIDPYIVSGAIISLIFIIFVYLYVLILAWGKKIKEMKPECQE